MISVGKCDRAIPNNDVEPCRDVRNNAEPIAGAQKVDTIWRRYTANRVRTGLKSAIARNHVCKTTK